MGRVGRIILQISLMLFAVIPGFMGALVSGYYVLQDWGALNRAYSRWEDLVRVGKSGHALLVAHDYQNMFRINCFADGVGVLLSAILCAVGLVGLSLLYAERDTN